MRLEAKVKMDGWDEKAYDEEVKNVKLAEVSAGFSLKGDIEGTSKIKFLMAYAGDNTPFVALEHIQGKVKGKAATLVLEHKGSFMEGGFHHSVRVVSGSGTGALAKASGSGVLIWSGSSDADGQLILDLQLP